MRRRHRSNLEPLLQQVAHQAGWKVWVPTMTLPKDWKTIEQTANVQRLRASGYLKLETTVLRWRLYHRITPNESIPIVGQEPLTHRQLAQLLAYLDWTGRP